MDSIRKWFYRPKKDDKSLLAQFFFADEALNIIASELDSFDGRKDPERCTSLVNQLRQSQDKVLTIINAIMDVLIGDERANRDFRVKFPEDVLQENLAGQLWFGAECLAAGSSIMNREAESTAMRPLAKALTKSLEHVRNLLRDACLRNTTLTTLKNNELITDMLLESLKIFDRLFAEFELHYVSAMVPVKTTQEYELQEMIGVLFSETLQRALKMNLLSQEMVDDCDPALMFTIPRLAIVSGLLIYPNGPLCIDKQVEEMSEMFRPFRTLLHKIRDLLWTLNKKELYMLEKLLCDNEQFSDIKSLSSVDFNSDLDDFVHRFYSDYPLCKDYAASLCPGNVNSGCSRRDELKIYELSNEDNVEGLNNQGKNEGVSNEGLNEVVRNEGRNERVSSEGRNQGSSDERKNELLDNEHENDKCKNNVYRKTCVYGKNYVYNNCKVGDSKIQNNVHRDGEHKINEHEYNENKDNEHKDDEHIDNNIKDDEHKYCEHRDGVNRDEEYVGAGHKNFLHDDIGYPQKSSTPEEEKPRLAFPVALANIQDLPSTSTGYLAANTIEHDIIVAAIGDYPEETRSESLPDHDSLEIISEAAATLSSILTQKEVEASVKVASDNVSSGCKSSGRLQSGNLESRNLESGNLEPGNLESPDDSGISTENTSLDRSPSIDLNENKHCSCESNSSKASTCSCYHQSIDQKKKHIAGQKAYGSSNVYSSSNLLTSSMRKRLRAVKPYDKTIDDDNSSLDSSDTSSFNSTYADDEEIALAMQAAEIASRNEIRSKFRSSGDLIHRLYVCIAGVADQLQTNFASDLRNILKYVFLVNTSDSNTTVEKIMENSLENSIEYRPSESEVIENNEFSVDPNILAQEALFDSNVYFHMNENGEDTGSSTIYTNHPRRSTDDDEALADCTIVEETHVEPNSIAPGTYTSHAQTVHNMPPNVSHNIPRSMSHNIPHNMSHNIPHNRSHNMPNNGTPHNYTHVTQNLSSRNPGMTVTQNHLSNTHGTIVTQNNSSSQGMNNHTAQNRVPHMPNENCYEQPPIWIPDVEAPKCMSCKANFTVVKRRHHCRNCGKIFCARCSSNSVPLPKFGHIKPVRVCNKCFLYHLSPFTM